MRRVIFLLITLLIVSCGKDDNNTANSFMHGTLFVPGNGNIGGGTSLTYNGKTYCISNLYTNNQVNSVIQQATNSGNIQMNNLGAEIPVTFSGQFKQEVCNIGSGYSQMPSDAIDITNIQYGHNTVNNMNNSAILRLGNNRCSDTKILTINNQDYTINTTSSSQQALSSLISFFNQQPYNIVNCDGFFRVTYQGTIQGNFIILQSISPQ